jgi:hypothetical protein
LAKINFDKQPISFEVNGENLFLLNENEKCCTISMYNQNLEMIQSFGQENSLLPFCFSPGIDLFLISNQYFIFSEEIFGRRWNFRHNIVTIINRSNGLVEASFKIHEDFDQMQFYLDKILITFDNETRFLKCYNFALSMSTLFC